MHNISLEGFGGFLIVLGIILVLIAGCIKLRSIFSPSQDEPEPKHKPRRRRRHH